MLWITALDNSVLQCIILNCFFHFSALLGCGWIHLTQDRVSFRAVLNILTNWATFAFPRRTLLRTAA
jgi:hypothetical protein